MAPDACPPAPRPAPSPPLPPPALPLPKQVIDVEASRHVAGDESAARALVLALHLQYQGATPRPAAAAPPAAAPPAAALPTHHVYLHPFLCRHSQSVLDESAARALVLALHLQLSRCTARPAADFDKKKQEWYFAAGLADVEAKWNSVPWLSTPKKPRRRRRQRDDTPATEAAPPAGASSASSPPPARRQRTTRSSAADTTAPPAGGGAV